MDDTATIRDFGCNSHFKELGGNMDKYRLKEVREDYNKRNSDKGIEITQEDMAKKCYTTKSTISRMEKGETEPTINTLIKYAETFDVSIDYLLRYADAKNPEHRTVSHELGLSDKAIETLKYIKKNAAFEDYDISALVNAFIGSGSATFDYFNDLFNIMSDEYGFSKYNNETEKEKMRNIFKLEQDMNSRTMEYLKFDVMPQLEKVIKDCYETLENKKLHTHNSEEAGK